jgi:hypothetical protein
VSTSAAGLVQGRRVDRWCAAALLLSAALRVGDWSGRIVRRPASVHLLRYSWTLTFAQAIVLVIVAQVLAAAPSATPDLIVHSWDREYPLGALVVP